MDNLDLKCAELGKRLAELKGVDEALLRDALSVLEEQGVYAFFLHLEAQGKHSAREVSKECTTFLQGTPMEPPLLEKSEVWQALQQLGKDLDNLLFARGLLRQALVYGRYHVKARGAAGGGS